MGSLNFCLSVLLLLSICSNSFASGCQPTTDTIAVVTCQGDTFYVGTKPYTQNGSYIDTLANAGGCDSIVTLNLTVKPILHQSVTITICSTNPYIIGNKIFDATGIYTDTITSSTGCDSIINLNLTVDQAVSLNWDALYNLNLLDASSGEPTAYWCHGDYPNVFSLLPAGIPAGGIFSGAGLSNDSLNADSLLQAGYTTDTISYYYFDGNVCNQNAVGYINLLYCLGVQSINTIADIAVYPNPATGQLFIKTENIRAQTTTIYDVNDRVIYTMPFKPEVDVNALSAGVYFIEVKNEGVSARKMFVKM